MALGFALGAVRHTGPARARCVLAAVTFAAFGLSDVVEVQTGAWYRPWWLFAWKAACVAVFAGLLAERFRLRKPK